MLKEHSSFIKQAVALIDCFLLAIAFLLAYYCAALLKPLEPFLNYWMMFIGFLGFYLYFAWSRSLFSLLQFTWIRHLVSRVIMIFVSAGALGAAILFMVPDKFHSRTLYLYFFLFSGILILVEKILLRAVIVQIRRHNRNTTPIILFGRGRSASSIIKKLEAHPEWGIRIVRIVDIAVSVREFEEILRSIHVEEIFFCIPRSLTKTGFKIDQYLQICEEMGRSARVFLNILGSTSFARWQYSSFLDSPTLLSHTVELDPDQLIFKRMFDIALSLVGMGVLVAVFPVLAFAIKTTSPGPIFFKQVRVGKNGKRFQIYKFRSMGIDAEVRKKELMSQNELSGAVFKMKNDPRVTSIGKLMRKLSLDELPQFINVLKGEMSMVGTRPPTPDEVAKYEKWHHRRISVKPGITGMWQVSGRNRITDFDEIVRLDLKYIDSWSVWIDIKIVFKTVVVLLERDQAY